MQKCYIIYQFCREIIYLKFFLYFLSKEQVEAEYKVRRDFPRKWGIHADSKINQRYDLQKIHKDLNERAKHLGMHACRLFNFVNVRNVTVAGVPENSGPYNYSGHGESYFVSKDMYKSLLGTCRCGRKKSGIHIVKCLQKPKNDYLPNEENQTKQKDLDCANFKGEKINTPTPGLSSG
jgi:hypothetical protein